MRVAIVIGNFPVISETFVLNQIAGLIDRGHDVHIYAIDQLFRDASAHHPQVEEYGLLERSRLLARPRPGVGRVGIARQALGLAARRFASNPACFVRNLPRLVALAGARGTAKVFIGNLSAMMDREPYDIIHCQFGTRAPRAMELRRFGSPGARVVVAFRGNDISAHVQRYGPGVYDEVFSDCDYFVTNCDFFRDRLVGMGCDPERLEVLRSGLDPDIYPFEARRPAGGGPVRIAMTGRLVEKKGTEYAIRAVARLLREGKPLEFRVMGDGELRDDLRRLIDELGVGGSVHLLGPKRTPEIVEELLRSHLFVAPSITATDGNQDAPINVLKEAMATGLPVVSTRHGGIPELVQEGVSGFLVAERDADALADRLSYLIDHPERWPEMGHAGRSFVEAHYNLHLLNDRLVEIYHRMRALPPVRGQRPSRVSEPA
ncbi:glycosyltransferase [Tautonia sp. JC769]|uniref:glycosyltransferase n=1 Tax=Tautonia sp. JC769 TaxID=3232135 RepID=UPI003459AE42